MELSDPVLVAGAGIGGLTAALSLRRHGFPVEVYDRRAGREVQLGGTGLTIWSNATTALGGLGLADRLLAAGDPILRARSVSVHDKVIFATPIQRFTWPDSVPAVSISRADLVALLLEACETEGVAVHLGQRVSGYEQEPDGVVLRFEDGRSVRGSVLVGADGIRSAVLQQLHGSIPMLYTGLSTYRGISDDDGGIDAGTVHLFEDDRRRIGGGAWHVRGGRMAWTLSREAPAGEQEPAGTLKDRATGLARHFAGPPPRLIAGTPSDQVIRTDIFYHDWHEPWGDGRVTLLGDAAHALPTVLGQGACQAIEDAVVLADALAAAADPVAGLRDYERRRIDRVRWVRGKIEQIRNRPQVDNPVVLWVGYRLLRVVIALTQPKMWRELQRPPELTLPVPPARSAVGRPDGPPA